MATIYSTGFEAGSLPSGWSTHSPTAKATTWAVDEPNASPNAPPTAYSGTFVLATNPTGNHATDEESVVDWVLPDLTSWTSVSASWAGWLDLVTATGCGAQIHLSTDGGATFAGVAGAYLSPTYNTSATSAGGVILAGIDRWTGLAPGAWTVRTFDLDAAIGAAPRDQVVVRFAFEARDGFAGRAGWYIDGVTLTGTLVDADPPEVEITSTDLTTEAEHLVTGTATDAVSTVTSVEVRLNGGAWTPATVDGADWSLSVTLAEGSNLVEVRATDANANTSEPVSQTVLLVGPPSPPGPAPTTLTVTLDGQQVGVDPWSTDLSPLDFAVVSSLLTDRRAELEDVLPVPEADGDRRGWWGDGFGPDGASAPEPFGSRLWLLHRATANQATATLARLYAEEALAWLVADGLLESLAVTAEVSAGAGGVIALTVSYRGARPASGHVLQMMVEASGSAAHW